MIQYFMFYRDYPTFAGHVKSFLLFFVFGSNKQTACLALLLVLKNARRPPQENGWFVPINCLNSNGKFRNGPTETAASGQ